MNDAGLTNITDAAAMFGVHRVTISDLVKKNKIPTWPMSNGNAKGLDRRGLEWIGRLLGINPRTLSAA